MNARTVRLFIPFGVSVVLLYLVFRSVQGEASQLAGSQLSDQLFATLSDAQWQFLPLAIGLYFVGLWVRSVRWGLLLPGYPVKTGVLFAALVVGFTVNNLLPFRMGEVARAYLLAQWARVPYGATVASLLVERVLDGLSLAVLLLLALALPLPQPPPGYLLLVGVLAAAGFLTGAVLLAIAGWRSSTVTTAARFVSRWLPPRFGARIEGLVANFATSLSLVHSAHRLARLFALSLLAWCFELSVFFVLLIGFRLPASYPLALLVGSAANFATLLPSSPGYAGTFDGVVIKVLGDAAGVGAVPALAYDVAVHYLTLFLPVVIVGLLVLWLSHLSLGQITHTPDRTSATVAGSERQAA